MLMQVDAACYRIAAVSPSPLQRQTIPRTIMQTGWSWEKALAHNEHFMQTWWNFNPEFEYRFYNDSQERAATRLSVNSAFWSIDAPSLDGAAAHKDTPAQTTKGRGPHR